ncbi:hypothetical protein ACFSCW_14255 [Sphingomonas tabacisoli]|uniref:4-amino-4-deoxy-L-arabinose transferase n=1 Tax=Sphingomonas tabacisoli TaxID=2249466 RepID=A0ABW4I818_9SPHN
MTPARPAPTIPLALILTVLLTAWWAALGWRDLGALRLPEAHDMLRLAQVRDWTDGQAFSDLTQARLGPPGGAAMTSSRLADLVPGFVIRVLSPLMGPRRAEIAAVVFWPELLFFVHLLLSGALARRLGGDASSPAAMALAALAFPAIAVLMPGRIAGQGLQLVLVEAMALGLLDGRLLLAGLAGGTVLLLGSEPLPALAGAMIWLAVGWMRDRRPVSGFGVGLLAAALVGTALLRPDIWPVDRCDGFTMPLLVTMLLAGSIWPVLGAMTRHLPDMRWRAGAAALLAILSIVIIWFAAPPCLSGWAEMSSNASWARAIAYAGLPLVALGYGVWLIRRGEPRPIGLFLSIIAASLLAAVIRLELAIFAAAFAAPLLAQWVMRAHGRNWALQAGLWLLCAGLVWRTLGSFAEPAPDPRAIGCTSHETLAALGRLDTGTFAAPSELSGYLIGATQHRSLAGGGRSNPRGNQAVADFFRATPAEARVQANLWTIDYVALCATPTGGLPASMLKPDGLAAHLLNGATPDWLEPVTLLGSDLPVWRVRAVAAPGLKP